MMIENILKEIAEAYSKLECVYAVVLAGSRTAKQSDELSDLRFVCADSPQRREGQRVYRQHGAAGDGPAEPDRCGGQQAEFYPRHDHGYRRIQRVDYQ